MTTFLRWGVFGILGVAALMYAYNASKHLAAARSARPAPLTAMPAEQSTQSARQPASAPTTGPSATTPPAPVSASPECEAEVVVAQRAVEMRKEGAPLDRVLRIREIAWQESPQRRQRLEQVATRWFGYEGDFRPETLRIAALSDCAAHSPRP